ncbi:hypothetical protein M422DRAFT_23230 [Sphaerobolus stellatus SS14]|nr:hypothetical protein M422DRAFT_23230 [Sphaerobolus stellatus SS14]
MSSPPFDSSLILSYLSLPSDHIPSPKDTPIDFLSKYLRIIPPNLLVSFSSILTPQQRTVLPSIRNRRQKYTSTYPKELSLGEARKKWPLLWEGRDRPGYEQGREERQWADKEFLGGQQQVGKLGQLLAEYEEEREAERFREARRGDLMSRMASHSLHDGEEGEEEEEEEEDDDDYSPGAEEPLTPQQLQSNFERLIRERFIYGLLDNIDYDAVDWDDQWDDTAERDSEEHWFDDEEEAEAPEVSETMRIEAEFAPPLRNDEMEDYL